MGLDGVEIVMEVEESFEIELPDEETVRVRTVGDLHRLVLSRLTRQPRYQALAGDALEAATWIRVQEIVVEQLGVAPKLVVPEARFIEDLGLD